MDGKIVIEMHHGGKFVQRMGHLVNKMFTVYTGGTINYYYDLDVDLMSYFELLGMVKQLGYNGDCKIYYRSPAKTMEKGLKLVHSDKEIPMLIEDSTDTGSVIVYVQHLGEGDEGGEGSKKGGEGSESSEEIPEPNQTEPSQNEPVSKRQTEFDENSKDGEGVGEGDGLEEIVDARYSIDSDDDVNSVDYAFDDEELIDIKRKMLDLKEEMARLNALKVARLNALGSDSSDDEATRIPIQPIPNIQTELGQTSNISDMDGYGFEYRDSFD